MLTLAIKLSKFQLLIMLRILVCSQSKYCTFCRFLPSDFNIKPSFNYKVPLLSLYLNVIILHLFTVNILHTAVYSIKHFNLNAASATCKSSTSLNDLQIYTRIVTFSQLVKKLFFREISPTPNVLILRL